jgi:methionine sulfoxide reductase heme-binding subunit
VSAGVFLADAAGNPSPYWYATRGLGLSTLVVLTVTVVLGILTATRWSGERTAGFVAVDLHRNFSLVAMLLLLAHIVTTVLDPFAHISLRDVIIPVGAAYRPVWLGLGVVAFWILVAVAATSLLRDRVGLRAWRIIHWAAYASWPLALVHGLGTGSDSRAPWMVAVAFACVAAVAVAIAERLRDGRLFTLPIRIAGAVATLAFLLVAGDWAINGPFEPGWSARAGTPPVKVAAVKGPVHPGPAGFSDPLVGVLVRDSAGRAQIALRDTVDTDLTITIRSPDPANETLPVMTISRGPRVLCTVPASVSSTLYAICNQTRLTITLYGSDAVMLKGGNITGRLDTSGPLN